MDDTFTNEEVNEQAEDVLVYKKIGSFNGYRSNAFFGFNIPQSPIKVIHFHLAEEPSK